MRAARLEQPVPSGTSTVPPDVNVAAVRRAQWIRRGLLGVLVVFLALSFLDLYGPDQATVSERDGAYELSVTYPGITRAGLDSPWSVELRRACGFDGPVTIRSRSSYFDRFDENGLDPQPASSTSDGTWTIWEFDPPTGEVLSVSFDARLSPTVQRGMDGATQVMEGDSSVIGVEYRTRVMP